MRQNPALRALLRICGALTGRIPPKCEHDWEEFGPRAAVKNENEISALAGPACSCRWGTHFPSAPPRSCCLVVEYLHKFGKNFVLQEKPLHASFPGTAVFLGAALRVSKVISRALSASQPRVPGSVQTTPSTSGCFGAAEELMGDTPGKKTLFYSSHIVLSKPWDFPGVLRRVRK